MSDDRTSDQLRSGVSATFDLVVRRHQARAMGTPRDEKALERIEAHHQSQRQAEREAYQRDYDSRVKHAEADIMAKRTRPMPRIKPPPGIAEPSLDHLIRQEAMERVDQDHRDRLVAIDQAEAREMTQFMEGIYRRAHAKDRARDDFNQTAERRSGRERRVRRRERS
jgi:hypothetical protein